MARQSKYLIALDKQISEAQKALAVAENNLSAEVGARMARVEALTQIRAILEKVGHPKKKAAPLKAVTAAQA